MNYWLKRLTKGTDYLFAFKGTIAFSLSIRWIRIYLLIVLVLKVSSACFNCCFFSVLLNNI